MRKYQKTYLILIVLVIVVTLYKELFFSSEELSENDVNASDETQYFSIEELDSGMEEIFSQRRYFVRSMCHELKLHIPGNDSLHRINAWEFMISEEHHLIWCNIFKAASSSWMYNFNILAGYTPEFLNETEKHPVDLARKKYPRPSVKELEQKLKTSTSFMIVRHPFERLVAVYYQKLVFLSDSIYYRNLSKTIVKQYRNENDKLEQQFPTFYEFIQFIIRQFHERFHGKVHTEMDMHWTPMIEFCTPCMVDFDYILKFENIQEEQKYLIKRTYLDDILKPQWRNKLNNSNSTRNMAKKEFKTVTKSQIEILYSLYRYDFLVFDYSIDEYLKLGKDD